MSRIALNNLDTRSLTALANDHTQLKYQVRNLAARVSRIRSFPTPQGATGFDIAKLVTDLPAFNASTLELGTADAYFYRVDTSATPKLLQTGGTYSVFNLKPIVVPADTFIMVQEDRHGFNWAVLGDSISGKQAVRFRLHGALAQQSSTAQATIDWQYGIGTPSTRTGAGEITVDNMPVSHGGYQFYGEVGAYGHALWDNGDTYQILQMECPQNQA